MNCSISIILPSSCGACSPTPLGSNSGSKLEKVLHIIEAYPTGDFLTAGHTYFTNYTKWQSQKAINGKPWTYISIWTKSIHRINPFTSLISVLRHRIIAFSGVSLHAFGICNAPRSAASFFPTAPTTWSNFNWFRWLFGATVSSVAVLQ